MVRKSVGRLAILAMPCAVLGGCAIPVVAGLTLNELSSATSVVSTGITGKGLGENIADLVLGKDCRIVEGLVRAGRDVCEERGSVATRTDFKGLMAFVEDDTREIPVAGKTTAVAAETDGVAKSAGGKLLAVKAKWPSAEPQVGAAPPSGQLAALQVGAAAKLAGTELQGAVLTSPAVKPETPEPSLPAPEPRSGEAAPVVSTAAVAALAPKLAGDKLQAEKAQWTTSPPQSGEAAPAPATPAAVVPRLQSVSDPAAGSEIAANKLQATKSKWQRATGSAAAAPVAPAFQPIIGRS